MDLQNSSQKPITKEIVLEYVRENGPTIPLNLSRALGASTLFMGAFLSELSDLKLVKVSSLKVGGSPLYYVPEQADRLQDFSKYLNEKDRRTYDLLKKEKVLRDSEQNPLVQVSLRAIKDYSIPLNVKIDGEDIQYFKWYLLSNEEAGIEVKKTLGIISEPVQQAVKRENNPNSSINNVNNAESASKEKLSESVKTTTESINKTDTVQQNQQKEQKTSKNEDLLVQMCETFFESNNITILKKSVEKKNKEVEFNISVPTQAGDILFFCKAIKKAKISDSDISKIYVQSSSEKLPVLFLYDGELGKKVADISANFINFKFKKLT